MHKFRMKTSAHIKNRSDSAPPTKWDSNPRWLMNFLVPLMVHWNAFSVWLGSIRHIDNEHCFWGRYPSWVFDYANIHWFCIAGSMEDPSCLVCELSGSHGWDVSEIDHSQFIFVGISLTVWRKGGFSSGSNFFLGEQSPPPLSFTCFLKNARKMYLTLLLLLLSVMSIVSSYFHQKKKKERNHFGNEAKSPPWPSFFAAAWRFFSYEVSGRLSQHVLSGNVVPIREISPQKESFKWEWV